MTTSPRINRREWRNVLLYALFIILLTSLPYALGYGRQGDQWAFSGFLFGADDGYSYIAKMRLGARGILDFYLFYTPEPHNSAPLIFLPYLLPGWLVGRFVGDHDPNLVPALTAIFHLMRVVFDAALIIVVYRFIAVFLRGARTRFTALLLATLGGGLGWLLLVAGGEPPEFLIPEGFSFLILLGLPHLALARAALLGGLVLMLKAVSQQSAFSGQLSAGLSQDEGLSPPNPYGIHSWGIRNSILAALCWLVVGMTVPFYLAILYVILGMWGLIAWIMMRRFPLHLAVNGGVAAALTLPLFLYYSVVFSSNPVFAAWSAQNILTSPPLLNYVLAYGLLVALAVVGGRAVASRAKMRDSRSQILDKNQVVTADSRQLTADSHTPQHTAHRTRYALLLWPVVVPLLVYLPMISVQRRLAEAIIVPLSILAAAGLRVLGRHRGWRRVRTPALVLLCASSLIFWVVTMTVVLSPGQPLYRPQAEVRALNWLNDFAPADSVVLAAFETGNILPAYTNLRPYVGHGPETLRALDKTVTVQQFFSGSMDEVERQALYVDYNIRYIVYGPQERALAGGTSSEPAWMEDVVQIYDAEGYAVYAVE